MWRCRWGTFLARGAESLHDFLIGVRQDEIVGGKALYELVPGVFDARRKLEGLAEFLLVGRRHFIGVEGELQKSPSVSMAAIGFVSIILPFHTGRVRSHQLSMGAFCQASVL